MRLPDSQLVSFSQQGFFSVTSLWTSSNSPAICLFYSVHLSSAPTPCREGVGHRGERARPQVASSLSGAQSNVVSVTQGGSCRMKGNYLPVSKLPDPWCSGVLWGLSLVLKKKGSFCFCSNTQHWPSYKCCWSEWGPHQICLHGSAWIQEEGRVCVPTQKEDKRMGAFSISCQRLHTSDPDEPCGFGQASLPVQSSASSSLKQGLGFLTCLLHRGLWKSNVRISNSNNSTTNGEHLLSN